MAERKGPGPNPGYGKRADAKKRKPEAPGARQARRQRARDRAEGAMQPEQLVGAQQHADEVAGVLGSLPGAAGVQARVGNVMAKLPGQGLLGAAAGLGPAGGVELGHAQAGLQAMQEAQREPRERLARVRDELANILTTNSYSPADVVSKRAEPLVREEARLMKVLLGLGGVEGEDLAALSKQLDLQAEQVLERAAGRALGSAGWPQEPPRQFLPLSEPVDEGQTGEVEVPRPPGKVWANLGNLRVQVLRLRNVALTLVERLGPSMLAPVSEEACNQAEKPRDQSALAEEIDTVAVLVVQLQHLLTETTQRLDL